MSRSNVKSDAFLSNSIHYPNGRRNQVAVMSEVRSNDKGVTSEKCIIRNRLARVSSGNTEVPAQLSFSSIRKYSGQLFCNFTNIYYRLFETKDQIHDLNPKILTSLKQNPSSLSISEYLL